MPRVHLHPGKTKRILGGHPWVYRGEIARLAEGVEDGDAVDVVDARGRPLGSGFYASDRTIAVRLLSSHHESYDVAFFKERLQPILDHRRWLKRDLSACRLIHSEGDRLGGLIADAYGDGVVLEFLTEGMRRRRSEIVEALVEGLKAKWIFAEGAFVHGVDPGPVTIEENGAKFEIQPGRGQKTGWFYDQKANRREALGWVGGGRALDLFCYRGALAIQAAMAGAKESVGVDISAEAIEAADRGAASNGVADRCRWETANAFDWLKAHEKDEAKYDLVWLDPPAFTKSKAALTSASRGYKEINLRAMRLTKPGGVLATSSCSFHMPAGLFRDLAAQAAADAKKRLTLIAERTQDVDHPIDPAIRESQYLKCLFFRVDDR